MMTCRATRRLYSNVVAFRAVPSFSSENVPLRSPACFHCRSQSTVSIASLWPDCLINVAQSVFCNVHYYTGLPWWGTIMVTAVATKLVVLPVDWWHANNEARVKLVMPELKVRQNAMLPVVLQQCKAENVSNQVYKKRLQRMMHKVVGQVLSEHRLVKYPFIVTLMVSIPTWISMVLGLRVLSCGLDPAGFPGITETLAVGGVLWFKNLLQADPCSVLPFVFPLSLWLKSEMHGLMNPPGGVFAKLYKTFLRLLPIPLCYLLQNAECGVLLFLGTLSLIGTVQDWLFYQPRVRRLLRIPKTSTEHEKPLQKISQEAYSRTKKFIERQK